MNSRSADSQPKFFMVYNPEDKKFIRVNFEQPQKRKLIKKKTIVQPAVAQPMAPTNNTTDDIYFP